MKPCRASIAAVVLTMAWAADAPGQCPQLPITPELQQKMDAATPTDFIPVVMMMQARADLERAVFGKYSKADRLKAVVQALWDAKEATLASGPGGGPSLVAELTALGSSKARDIQAHWVVNAVSVEATKDVIVACAQRSDIAMVSWAGPQNMTVSTPGGASGTLPNITAIRAPEVWPSSTGAGVVVGIIGTGGPGKPGRPNAHQDLPNVLLKSDLVTPFFHDVFDVTRTLPYDDHGVSTHLLGVAVGQNGYGVAPGAKWIACKAIASDLHFMRDDILQCGGWLMNPDQRYDAQGKPDPIPQNVPDVILGAFAGGTPGTCAGVYHEMVRAWRAAKILPVMGTGEYPDEAVDAAGLGVPVPASHPETFSVGAADLGGEQLINSYRGPANCLRDGLCFCGDPACGTCTGESPAPPGSCTCGDPGCPKAPCVPLVAAPRVVAPGKDVDSAWLVSTPSGTITDGSPSDHRRLARASSAVAAAHAAGAAALIMAKYPEPDRPLPEYVDRALQWAPWNWEPRLGTGPDFTNYVPPFLDAKLAFDYEDAVFHTQSPPHCEPGGPCPLRAKDQFTASVQMRNMGVSVWLPNEVDLVPYGEIGQSECGVPQNWGPSRLRMTEAKVRPGEIATFEFGRAGNPSGVVPYPTGPYTFTWIMRRMSVPNPNQFGFSSELAPIVTQGQDNFRVYFENVALDPPVPFIDPCTAQPPGCGRVDVVFENTGSKKWAKGTYVPAELDGRNWLPSASLALPEDVCPNDPVVAKRKYRIPLTTVFGVFCAPAEEGTYPFQFTMKKNGVELPCMNQDPALPCRLSCSNTVQPTWTGQFQGWASISTWPTLPALWPQLQSWEGAWITAAMKNTGTAIWRDSADALGHILGSRFVTLETLWPAGVSELHPGATANFKVRIASAGVPPGRWPLLFEMHHYVTSVPGTQTSSPPNLVGHMEIPYQGHARNDWTGYQGGTSGLWTYRHFRPTENDWAKMDCGGSDCVVPGNDKRIYLDAGYPGSVVLRPGANNGVALVWKAPFTRQVRARVYASGIGGTCGDGVRFRVLHYSRDAFGGVIRYPPLLDSTTGAGSYLSPFNAWANVAINDTIRFVVDPRSNNNCDATQVLATIESQSLAGLEGQLYPIPPTIEDLFGEPE
jgi:hypothetical protein